MFTGPIKVFTDGSKPLLLFFSLIVSPCSHSLALFVGSGSHYLMCIKQVFSGKAINSTGHIGIMVIAICNWERVEM